MGTRFHSHDLDNVTLPSELQSLSFTGLFNRSLEKVTLPSGLRSLAFGHKFAQSLERVTLPSGVQVFRVYELCGARLYEAP